MSMPLHSIMLHTLSEQSLSGYSLCKEIEQKTGQKPSFGSIYPILERFLKENLVTVKKDGRKKIYTITAKGKSQAKEFRNKRTALIDDMIQQSKTFAELTECDPEPMVAMLEKLKKGEDPLHPIAKEAVKLRDLLFTMSQDGRINKHQKEIKHILNNTIKRLENI